MDGRPILPSGCVGWWIYIVVYNIFIPPRARELLLYLYMTTHFNITISFPRLAFFYFLVFFFSSSAFYLFDMYCLPIHLFLFLLFFSSFEKKKSYFVSNREPSGLFFPLPTQSLNPAYLKAQAL